jgi:ABC-2 type transport system permease protein
MVTNSRQSLSFSPLPAWRSYAELARKGFQRQLAYRTANLAGLATNAFFGALRAYVLIALFNARGGEMVAGYSVRAAVTYTGLAQALIAYIAIWGWWDLIRTIRSGEVASDLLKPLNYFGYWCAQDVGRGVAQMLMRGLPMMALYALVYPITLPPTLWHWLALAASLGLALLISFGYRFIVSLSAFWAQDATGIGRAAWTASTFFSGFLMPLALLPDEFVAFCRLTPFPAVVNTPVEIYLGLLDGPALLGALGVQVAWFVILYILAQIILAAGIKKLVIQGG